MDQQQYSSQLSSNNNNNLSYNNEGIEQGQLIEIKQKVQSIKIKKQKKINKIQDSDSQWSWDSIQQLKGIDLKKLQVAQQDDHPFERIQNQKKQKNKIKVIYPQKPKQIEKLPIKYVGKATQKVGDLLIIEADLKQTYQIVDLDGWVCDSNKNFIGFVIDVFGKIQTPFYAIKPQENIQNPQAFVNKQIYYIQGTKILNQQQVKSIQTKNKQQYQDIQQSDQSDKDNDKQQLSQQMPEIYRQHRINQNQRNITNKRFRKNSYDGNRNQQRSRTRQNFRNKPNNNYQHRQNNQQYLQNMYAMHYAQMMQFYNPNYQANTMNPNYGQNLQNNQIPPPPPMFMQGHQPPRNYNPFMPQNNFQQNMKK